jgi:Kef-type K+ transport system membrane component KefB
MSAEKKSSSREEISLIVAIVIGLILGILIKKVRIGLIIGLVLGGMLLFTGWLNVRKRDD